MAGEGLMGIHGNDSSGGVPEGLPLAEVFSLLDTRRANIDLHMTSLSPGDLAQEELWQELESVLEKIREVVRKLAKSAAADLPELRAKATILTLLLRPGCDGAGPTIPEPETVALALSLAEDVARLPDG
jgi:hypothetical protein